MIHKRYPNRYGNEARNKNICDLRRKGMTYTEIGNLYSLSGERVRQIIVFANDRAKEVAK